MGAKMKTMMKTSKEVMKTFTTLKVLVGLLVCLLFTSIPAQAQQAPREPRQTQRQGDAPILPILPVDPKDPSMPSEENRQSGRLTPEERRQLRIDIRDHGREVYKDQPRRP